MCVKPYRRLHMAETTVPIWAGIQMLFALSNDRFIRPTTFSISTNPVKQCVNDMCNIYLRSNSKRKTSSNKCTKLRPGQIRSMTSRHPTNVPPEVPVPVFRHSAKWVCRLTLQLLKSLHDLLFLKYELRYLNKWNKHKIGTPLKETGHSKFSLRFRPAAAKDVYFKALDSNAFPRDFTCCFSLSHFRDVGEQVLHVRVWLF